VVILGSLFAFSAFAQGPCFVQSSNLACVIPQEYGAGAVAGFKPGSFSGVLYPVGGHPIHFRDDFAVTTLRPLTAEIGREANLLPLASPSSGVVLVYDPNLKTLVTGTESLGPVLGERAETVGRHHLFVGFSYQFFNFDQLDGVNLNSFPVRLTHTDDNFDITPRGMPPTITCSTNGGVSGPVNLDACAFVRDRIDTLNSINLKINQYTSYITFGLTKRIDVSMVIPIENVRMALTSQDTIVPGTNGQIPVIVGSPNQTSGNRNTTNPPSNGPPYFFHLFHDCPNTSPASGVSGLAPSCLQHAFPDAAFTGNGSQPRNSATGIGDVVARVKWNAWEGERAGFAAGMDVRFPTGDALNYLGSGSYGFKPFAVFSYRARIAPHVLVGYEWNTDSITAGDLVNGGKGSVPNDFVYTVGADASVTKWLTADFDIVGQRVFGTQTVTVTSQQFLGNCGSCSSSASPVSDVTLNSLTTIPNSSYNITNASMGIKARPFGHLSRLVLTANVLVRLDDGGLRSKPVPLVGLGYTF
jgi:Putative MetA-pathway of phenol degradation